ncbi:hypothetical protein ACFE04_020322 [Oxalis oulophora]
MSIHYCTQIQWFLLLSFISFSLASIDFTPSCSDSAGNYTNNSSYLKNLKTLFSSMISDTNIDYGFYNMSAGQGEDKVEAIALCRGDVDPTDCRRFMNLSAIDILAACPNDKEAIGWFDEIMLRYSDTSILHALDQTIYFNLISPTNISEGSLDRFNQKLQSLLRDLQSKAAAGDSRRKYAAGNFTLDFHTIYSLVQCTPDLTVDQCTSCLVQATGEIESCCYGSDGARVLKGSCSVRFETDWQFFGSSAYSTPSSTPATKLTPPTESSGSKKTNRTTTIIIIVVSIFAALMLIISVYIFMRRRARKTKERIDFFDDDMSGIKSAESMNFNFNTIKAATNNFCTTKKLGQGGFGPVYKAAFTYPLLIRHF